MDKTDLSSVITGEDREFFERELKSFVPDRVFDAHCHLWKAERFSSSGKDDSSDVPESFSRDFGYEDYMQALDALLPGRKVAALFIPSAHTVSTIPEANEWTASQVAKDRLCRGNFRVQPKDDPEWVRESVRKLGLHGLKCYHTSADVEPTWEADIPDYLPESLVEAAGEEGWVITLHMVKSRAVADPENIRWIRHFCTTYPGMKLILAHSARAFQPSHNFEGLPQLADLDNLYCDCSANCEPLAHETIIKILGHRKLLFGTDFFVSHMRGRSVGVADTFLWLYRSTAVWREKHRDITPVCIGYESLRSLKWACWSAGLSDGQIEDIFWNNAADIFGLSDS